MRPYPSVNRKDLENVIDAVQFIVRQRELDIRDWNNLQNIFVNGRKVARIAPTGSADVLPTDKVGDIIFDEDYVYYLYHNAGTAEWRRIIASAW